MEWVICNTLLVAVISMFIVYGDKISSTKLFSGQKSTSYITARTIKCDDKKVIAKFEELFNTELAKVYYSIYAVRTFDIKEEGYNPKLNIRGCTAKIEVNNGNKTNDIQYQININKREININPASLY